MKINNNYSFSGEVKKEICLNYFERIENQKGNDFLFLAFLLNIAEYNLLDESLEFLTQNTDVIKLFKVKFKDKLTIYKSNQKSLKYNTTKYKVALSLKKLSNLKEIFLNSEIKLDFKNNDSQKQFITGLFLSTGSINNPSKSYHLEIRIINNKLIEYVEKILSDYMINFSHIIYRNKYVFYIKRSESISDFLKILGADQNMYLLEDYRIEKDFHNSLQRLNNLEVSNIKKQIVANQKIINIIKNIQDKKEFLGLSQNIKWYCQLRVEYEDISLSDMVNLLEQRYNIKVSKSWLNHTNNKLIKIFEKYN